MLRLRGWAQGTSRGSRAPLPSRAYLAGSPPSPSASLAPNLPCRPLACLLLACPPQVETVATTLALAEQNNARELKRVCLEFVSKHLQAVMASEGYHYMVQTCPQLQAELLQVGRVGGASRGLHVGSGVGADLPAAAGGAAAGGVGWGRGRGGVGWAGGGASLGERMRAPRACAWVQQTRALRAARQRIKPAPQPTCALLTITACAPADHIRLPHPPAPAGDCHSPAAAQPGGAHCAAPPGAGWAGPGRGRELHGWAAAARAPAARVSPQPAPAQQGRQLACVAGERARRKARLCGALRRATQQGCSQGKPLLPRPLSSFCLLASMPP